VVKPLMETMNKGYCLLESKSCESNLGQASSFLSGEEGSGSNVKPIW
jgi:hypothetical protein